MAAKAVELVQLVGRVAGAGPHLPDLVQIDSANNQDRDGNKIGSAAGMHSQRYTCTHRAKKSRD